MVIVWGWDCVWGVVVGVGVVIVCGGGVVVVCVGVVVVWGGWLCGGGTFER